MSFPRRLTPIISISFLLATVGVISLGTNAFLASMLPVAQPPGWTDMKSKPVDGDLLHIVTTRFMQFQPHLSTLGRARLFLFETFCLPSMIGQVNDDYIWTILTDPSLEESLMQRLITMLSPYPNYYLVLSNEKRFVFRDLHTMKDQILTGDVGRLYDLLQSPTRRLVLQTRLDADDGLHHKAISKIQETARIMPNDQDKGWQVICASLHFEWRNDDITVFNVTTPGKLRVLKENICITPGFTLVKHRNSTSLHIPVMPMIYHHLVTRVWPECLVKNVTSDCWIKLNEHYPGAIRSRTITSAGMSRINTKPSDSDYDKQTDVLWGYVQRNFGIQANQAYATSIFLQDNFPGIVEDNLIGQCTDGHSCKNSSKAKLQTLLEISHAAGLGGSY